MSLNSEVVIDKTLEIPFKLFEQIPFNNLLSLTPTRLTAERCEFSIKMKDELIGNWVSGILHGGAISTALDVTGGAMVFISNWLKMGEENTPMDELARKLGRMGTIDMRVDFLHLGKGKEFTTSATLLRAGNKVAVTRMEFHNEEGVLIAAGTGTYLCG
ncbi:MAG TPA: thioesterase family protein [Pseudomonadales bacterium]|nr:thioesterase family protein [Pseudomonadales bacterium]